MWLSYSHPGSESRKNCYLKTSVHFAILLFRSDVRSHRLSQTCYACNADHFVTENAMAKQAHAQFVSATSIIIFLCYCVVCVVTEVQLTAGTGPLNNHDPVQYKDCGELHKAGYNVSGPHVLYMNKTAPFLIHCEFTKYEAYNVIQRRQDYSVNFMESLDTYISGFGYVQGDYWAGLNAISHLTMSGNKALTIYMQNGRGINRNAHYTHFMVQPQNLKYQMTVAGFSGAGLLDDMGHSTGMPFHTFDVPDPKGCAVQMKAGWWYNYCAYTLPTGYYYPPGTYKPSGKFFDGIFWESFGGFNNSLKFISMSVSQMMRARVFASDRH